MDVNDNLIYLCIVAAVVAAALFAWLAYDSSSMTFIWGLMTHEYAS